VTVLEAQVGLTVVSDRNKKENFRSVNLSDVLGKLRGVPVTSWNYIGHDVTEFRHYGPMAQDFFSAFGHDDVGAIGSDVTINSSDLTGILMAAIQALDRQAQEREQRLTELEAQLARLEALLVAAPVVK
jgi:hypothetical protein